MIRFLACAAALLVSPPALAEMFLTIDNQSSQMVDRVNTFPLGEDGEPIEDNVGSTMDVLSGRRSTYRISNDSCGVVRVYIVMEDESELEGDFDVCDSQTVIVQD